MQLGSCAHLTPSVLELVIPPGPGTHPSSQHSVEHQELSTRPFVSGFTQPEPGSFAPRLLGQLIVGPAFRLRDKFHVYSEKPD